MSALVPRYVVAVGKSFDRRYLTAKETLGSSEQARTFADRSEAAKIAQRRTDAEVLEWMLSEENFQPIGAVAPSKEGHAL